MTQIVSQLCRGFVLQVADRLVMKTQAGRASEPFDALANKNLIYWARDAIACMGYTGPAYVGSLPTDDWIAGKLTGLDVSMDFGMRTGPLPHWWDIGQAINLLKRELKLCEIAAHKENFELVIVGWQWKKGKHPLVGRRQPVPMGCLIRKSYGKSFDDVERLPRHWYWKPGARFLSSPEGDLNLSQTELKQLAQRMHSLPAGQFEQTIVDTIRTVAARNPYVGPNCMSILLAPPHVRPFVRVTFFPQEIHPARFVGSKFVSPEYSAAFSPWVIGAQMVSRPSVLIGNGWSLQMGPFTVELGGGVDDGPISGMSSQKRPQRATR
jgi:hypothetical protein